MKKVLAWMLGCFMVLGVTAAQADVRTDSLGLSAGQQVDDLDSIWLFPQDAARNGNVVDFRLGFTNGSSADNWGGIIHKDWDDVGYIGIYTKRPFDQSNGIVPNVPAANQNGILNGAWSWGNIVSPYYSSLVYNNNHTNSGAYVGDTIDTITSHYALDRVTLNNQRIQTPENKLDLFWAKEMTDTTFGVHVNYAANTGFANAGQDGNDTGSYTQGFGTPGANTPLTVAENGSTSVLGLDLGLGLKNLGGLDSLDLGVGYSLGSVNYTYTDTQENAGATGTEAKNTGSVKDNNISEIRINALAKAKINDNATMRIYANGKLGNYGVNGSFVGDNANDGSFTDAGDVRTGSNTYSDTNVNLGIACDHKVADGKAKVIAGVELIYDDQSWKQTDLANLGGSSTADQVQPGSGSTLEDTWWVVPVNIAVEAPLFDWLKARVGASHPLFQSFTAKGVELTNGNAGGTAFQSTTTSTQTQDLASNLDMSYGVSAQFQNFTMDLQVSQSVFESYLSTFQPGAGIFYGGVAGMFTQADLRYAF